MKLVWKIETSSVEILDVFSIIIRYYELKGKTSLAKNSRDGQKYDKPRTADAVNFIRDSAVSHWEVQPNTGLIMLPTLLFHTEYVSGLCAESWQPILLEAFQAPGHRTFLWSKGFWGNFVKTCHACGLMGFFSSKFYIFIDFIFKEQNINFSEKLNLWIIFSNIFFYL